MTLPNPTDVRKVIDNNTLSDITSLQIKFSKTIEKLTDVKPFWLDVTGYKHGAVERFMNDLKAAGWVIEYRSDQRDGASIEVRFP